MLVFPNAVFEPTLTSLMGAAFDEAVRLLGAVPSKINQEAMASRIIEAAGQGERNVARLREAALMGMAVAATNRLVLPQK